jgi:branched-chain amino acid transport system substrate-binding protein
MGAHARQEPGPHVVHFGMSTALSGPAANLGHDMRAGVLAAFNQSNLTATGVGRPRIELTVLDDGYEPARCATAVRSLITEHRVIALVGDVGTPTAVVAVPICRETGTLYIGAFTGAGLLRPDPPDPIIFNFRASYEEETASMVDALVDIGGLSPSDIGFFTQRDAYGDAGYQGGLKALRGRGLPRSGPDSKPLHARYERNTTAVESAVAEFLIARPKAVIMVGAYAPTATFVRLCKESGYSPVFLSVSFVGPESLALSLGDLGDGVIITQVVPTLDSGAPVLEELIQALSALPDGLRSEPTLGSLEGYIVGRIVVMALDRCDPPYTDDRLAEAMKSLGSFDVGLNVPLRLGPDDHQASHTVWPSIIDNKGLVGFSWADLPAVLQRGADDPGAEEGHAGP